MGETGQEEMQDVREVNVKDGDQGSGMGRGINMTLICGSLGVEVEMV